MHTEHTYVVINQSEIKNTATSTDNILHLPFY